MRLLGVGRSLICFHEFIRRAAPASSLRLATPNSAWFSRTWLIDDGLPHDNITGGATCEAGFYRMRLKP